MSFDKGNLTNKYGAVDGLRVISCIGIVMMHVLANGHFGLDGFFFNRIIPSFANLVFLFMSISAFGMCCGYFNKFINKSIDISDFYIKRYKKILPFFALLCLIDFVFAPSLESFYEVFANLTLCFGLIPNAEISVIGVGWFLGTVFAFYLLFPYFCFLISNKKRAWVALIVSFMMNYLCANYFNTNRKSIVYCFVYFLVGGLVFLYKEKIQSKRIVKYISFLGLILSIFCYYALSSNTLIICLINAWALLISISVHGNNVLDNRILHFVGGLSFEIYLCHMVVFRVIEKVGAIKKYENDYINYFVCCFWVLLLSGLVAFLYKTIVSLLKKNVITTLKEEA